MSVPDVIAIRVAVLQFKHAYWQMDGTSPICLHFMHIIRRKQNNNRYVSSYDDGCGTILSLKIALNRPII
jgi:hypothetical protein